MNSKAWRDLYDEQSDTRMRVSPNVLERLGYDGTLQIALAVKARNPPAARRNAVLARGYAYTANGIRLIASVFLLLENGQRVPVIRISTHEEWAEYHSGREERN
jgi:hypothetical protein